MKKRGLKNTLLILLILAFSLQVQAIQSPEQYFGFKMGADHKLVKWPQTLEYFDILDAASDKITVKEIGKSTMGNPIIVAFISSAANLSNLDRYKEISRKLANPRNLSSGQAATLIKEGKVIIVMTCALHATEIASHQLSHELAYDLITKDTPQIREMLDKVILIVVPSLNPDGNIMMVDWYYKNLGTPYESSRMPWLYHKYAGHDNNRDGFMLNLQETRVISKFYYKEWFPQIVYDPHQMGRSGVRFFVPPFIDPVNSNIHPLIWREIDLLGTNLYREMEERGQSGVAHSISYTSFWQGSLLLQTWWHNMAGFFTEGASVKMASPVFQKVEELTGHRLGLPEYKLKANFTHPWPGGWWRLGDLVDYTYAATIALMDTGAKYKDNFLNNFYRMNVDAIEKGKTEPPYAFVVSANQHDPNTAAKMMNLLIQQGAEVHIAQEDFTADSMRYPRGSYVLLLSQPFRPFVKDIMEKQVYPDLRLYPGGPPIPPYDVSGYTLPLQMGVSSAEIAAPFDADLMSIKEASPPEGKIESQASYAYILGHETNDSLIAVNRLLKAGYDVYWSKEAFDNGGRKFPAGTMIIPVKSGIHSKIASIAKDLSLQVYAANRAIQGQGYKIKPLRLALYNPWGGNMDVGWCTLLLEQFEFPFEEIRNADIKAGNLKNRYDVILFADMSKESIINGLAEDSIPPEYAGGIGGDGILNLKAFVQSGGTLITLDSSCSLPVESFGLPVNDVLKDLSREKFFCPGSIVEIELDNSHPIAYGMESKSAGFFARSPAFDLLPSFNKEKARVVVKYPQNNPLLSGWILGENHLFNKFAVIDVPLGKGRVILLAFRVQHRIQPHGTFKLLFNSLYYGPATLAKLP